jgi:hypothetical protein
LPVRGSQVPMPTISVSTVGGTEVKGRRLSGVSREPVQLAAARAPARSESSAGGHRQLGGLIVDRGQQSPQHAQLQLLSLGGGAFPADVNHDDLHGTLAVNLLASSCLHIAALGGTIR